MELLEFIDGFLSHYGFSFLSYPEYYKCIIFTLFLILFIIFIIFSINFVYKFLCFIFGRIG